MMEISSAHEDMFSVGLPSAWEDREPSPRSHTPCIQGLINMPPSPQTFSDYFQDTTLSTSISQDPTEFMMFQLAKLSHMETTEYAGSLPTDPLALTAQQQLDLVALPVGINQASSVSAAAVDASKSRQQSKPLSRHQIYRLNVKGKAKFKHLSHQILNEHVKMLNEELIRMTGELKTKDEQLSHLLLENGMLREENKRLKLTLSPS